MFVNDLSGKPLTAKLKVNPRAGLGRGRQTRFSPAAAPGTPIVPMRGTLHADRLRITGPGGGPNLSDHLESKRPLVETTTSNTKAEAPAKDALAKRKSGLRSGQLAYTNKDPREIMKTLRQGTHNFVGKFDELLDGLEAQLEVWNHSPSPKHFGRQKFPRNVLAG